MNLQFLIFDLRLKKRSAFSFLSLAEG